MDSKQSSCLILLTGGSRVRMKSNSFCRAQPRGGGGSGKIRLDILLSDRYGSRNEFIHFISLDALNDIPH